MVGKVKERCLQQALAKQGIRDTINRPKPANPGMAKSPWKIENPSYGPVFQGHVGKPARRAQVLTHVVGFVFPATNLLVHFSGMENKESFSARLKGFVNAHPVWSVVIGLFVVFFVLTSLSGSNATPTNNVPASAAVNTPSQPSGPVSSFGDGTFIVNTDIEPGTYKSSGSQGCYYARLSGFGGTTDDIIANDNTNSPAIVTIKSTDKGFVSTRCGTWTQLPASSTSNATSQTTTKKTSVPATPSAPAQTYTTPSGAVVNTQGSTVVAPPPPPASWHTVETFSGATQKNTAPFVIKGSQWRITWQENGQGYFGADGRVPTAVAVTALSPISSAPAPIPLTVMAQAPTTSRPTPPTHGR